ncbi:hypothetical protein pEaSNUABM44_00040 [Erwinia phage pEa_SNUABM_44]|nr:hypothetical protein pEaSNUABM44_00040 [Erwinia phage pEa_SNUABM_44]
MNFTTNSFNDVLVLAKTFGVAALDYAVQNNTINIAFPALVRECKRWATRQIIELQNVNDGNLEYSIDAVFKAELVLDQYDTNLNDITVVRTGFGAYTKPVRQAMQDGDINADTLEYILNDVRQRNEARKVLGL